MCAALLSEFYLRHTPEPQSLYKPNTREQPGATNALQVTLTNGHYSGPAITPTSVKIPHQDRTSCVFPLHSDPEKHTYPGARSSVFILFLSYNSPIRKWDPGVLGLSDFSAHLAVLCPVC